MGDSFASNHTDSVDVLCVGSDSVVDDVAEALDEQRDRFNVCTASSGMDVDDVLDGSRAVDCLVIAAAFANDTEFLGRLRARRPALPVVIVADASTGANGGRSVVGRATTTTFEYEGGDGIDRLATEIETRVDQYRATSRADTENGNAEQSLAFRTALLEAQAETTIDGLLVVDEERNVLYHNDRFLELWDIPPSVAASRSDEKLLASVESMLTDPAEFREKVDYLYDHPDEESRDTIRLTDGRWLDRYSATVTAEDGTRYGRLWLFRDITERKQREQTLRRQRNELAQLQRINTLVREIDQAVQGKTTRDGIERAVCDRLTDSELYEAAWIGASERGEDGDRQVAVRTVSGPDEAALAAMRDDDRFARRALDTGEIQVVENRSSVSANGAGVVGAVPLETEGTTYGVLVVHAPQLGTFDEREQTVLTDFGRTIARAIQRVNSRRSLTADTAVEIELTLPAATNCFATVSDELDCELVLDRRVPATGGTGIYYISVEGADPALVCDHLRDAPTLDACNVVRTTDDATSGVIEVVRSEESWLPLDELIAHGAAIRRARAFDGDIQLVAEVPPEVEIRTLVEAIRDGTGPVDLDSKQVINRPMTTIPDIKNQVRAQMTQKQEAAVKTAYARGYYAWPRESTAEELADVLDISASTLHYHLRHAHQSVLAALFEEYEERSMQSRERSDT